MSVLDAPTAPVSPVPTHARIAWEGDGPVRLPSGRCRLCPHRTGTYATVGLAAAAIATHLSADHPDQVTGQMVPS